MKLLQQMATDLETLQHGRSWIGYNAAEILADVDSQTAQWKPHATGNCIWDLVNHISFWREIVAEQLRSKMPVWPKSNGFEPVAIMDREAWQQTKKRFEQAYRTLHDAILSFDEYLLYEKLGNKGSYYENIIGCLQHDAFHLGQVMQLKRMAQALKKDEQF